MSWTILEHKNLKMISHTVSIFNIQQSGNVWLM